MEEIILNLVKIFEKRIPQNEKDRVEIIEAYKNYLYLTVKTIQESTSKFIDKDIDSIVSVLNGISNDFSKNDLDSIKQFLIVDDALKEIRKKSIGIFEMAKSKMDGKKADVQLERLDEIEEMQEMSKSVKSYNQKIAQELISEAILDLGYLIHPDRNILSLRLHHFTKQIESRDEERE